MGNLGPLGLKDCYLTGKGSWTGSWKRGGNWDISAQIKKQNLERFRVEASQKKKNKDTQIKVHLGQLANGTFQTKRQRKDRERGAANSWWRSGGDRGKWKKNRKVKINGLNKRGVKVECAQAAIREQQRGIEQHRPDHFNYVCYYQSLGRPWDWIMEGNDGIMAYTANKKEVGVRKKGQESRRKSMVMGRVTRCPGIILKDFYPTGYRPEEDPLRGLWQKLLGKKRGQGCPYFSRVGEKTNSKNQTGKVLTAGAKLEKSQNQITKDEWNRGSG